VRHQTFSFARAYEVDAGDSQYQSGSEISRFRHSSQQRALGVTSPIRRLCPIPSLTSRPSGFRGLPFRTMPELRIPCPVSQVAISGRLVARFEEAGLPTPI
jgi:hypothetical protein